VKLKGSDLLLTKPALLSKALLSIQTNLIAKLALDDYPQYDFSCRIFCNLILSLNRHKVSNLDELLKSILFELDRHIRDRLSEATHVQEYDNYVFNSLNKVGAIKDLIRKDFL